MLYQVLKKKSSQPRGLNLVNLGGDVRPNKFNILMMPSSKSEIKPDGGAVLNII
jgi:hypothetical protein